MGRIRKSRICHFVFLLACLRPVSANDSNFDEIESFSDTGESERNSEIVTTMQNYRRSRMYRRGHQEDSSYMDDHDDQHDDHDMENDKQNDMKAMVEGKVDYWGGYYDFLINEGSYKFWAVFQLATAALLIYSGFAALYYAKVNPPSIDDEFDDIFRRRRKRRSSIRPCEKPFCGLDDATFQRIIDAATRGTR